MPNIGPVEIGIVLLIVLIIWGPRRLPELGRSLGSGMRNFKDSVTGKDDEPRGEIEPPAADSSSETAREPTRAGDAAS
jgi:sec-independent protein translocase protein TatA